MAVYTKLDKEKIDSILSNYNLGSIKKFEGIKEGIENKHDDKEYGDTHNDKNSLKVDCNKYLAQSDCVEPCKWNNNTNKCFKGTI